MGVWRLRREGEVGDEREWGRDGVRGAGRGGGGCKVVESGGRCEGGGVCVFSLVFRGCSCCFLRQLEVVSVFSFFFCCRPQIRRQTEGMVS